MAESAPEQAAPAPSGWSTGRRPPPMTDKARPCPPLPGSPRRRTPCHGGGGGAVDAEREFSDQIAKPFGTLFASRFRQSVLVRLPQADEAPTTLWHVGVVRGAMWWFAVSSHSPPPVGGRRPADPPDFPWPPSGLPAPGRSKARHGRRRGDRARRRPPGGGVGRVRPDRRQAAFLPRTGKQPDQPASISPGISAIWKTRAAEPA